MNAPPAARGRRPARWAFAAAVLVCLGFSYAAKDLVFERIYLRRLATGDGLEQRIAARQLVKLRSRRAVEPLVELLRGEEGKLLQGDELTWVPRALFGIGSAGIEAALSAGDDEDDLKWLLRHGIDAESTDAPELLPHLTRRLERKEHRDVLMEAIASLGGLTLPLLSRGSRIRIRGGGLRPPAGWPTRGRRCRGFSNASWRARRMRSPRCAPRRWEPSRGGSRLTTTLPRRSVPSSPGASRTPTRTCARRLVG